MKWVLLGLLLVADLAIAPKVSAAEEAAPEVVVRVVEPPKGVCHGAGPGVSVVVENTTEAACRERQAQCERDHPGRETDCHARWTENAKNKAKKLPASR
jgi:hypothetical protein